MMTEVMNLTYEVLFELVMREKSREELQKLPGDFVDSSIGYILKKRQMAMELAEGQKEAAERQANNAVKLLKELYERREKKLVNLALLKARAENAVIDYGIMMLEERQFFEALLALMKSHRQLVFNTRLEAAKPQKIIVTKGAQQAEEEQDPDQPTKLVRFLNPVPKFVGKELEVYGPFEEEEMANLPADIADILIKKGRAEEVSGN
ncbi:MAG TPA: hypothetical protein VJB90_05370 [Candidatus Nanoarchaeia archaeon]|nr:hypothetical protein [Candidatus Nanoarchaeia archaeon]